MNTAEKQQALDAARREMIDRPYEVSNALEKEELQANADAIRAVERPEGRYSISEAIVLLLAETGEYFRVGKATWDGELRAYAPGSRKPIDTKGNNPKNWMQYDASAEVYRHDLNGWLAKEFPEVSYKFPEPSAPALEKVGAGDTALQDKDEPPMHCGSNTKAACIAWIKWQAHKLKKTNDTIYYSKVTLDEGLVARIIKLANEPGRKYSCDGREFKIEFVRKNLPEQITGGLRKNGSKSPKSELARQINSPPNQSAKSSKAPKP